MRYKVSHECLKIIPEPEYREGGCSMSDVALITFLAITLTSSISLASPAGGKHPVTDYGAAPGAGPQTDAMNRTVRACAEAGGGTVVVPPGRFITGPIELQSNVELHLEPGAILEGVKDADAYHVNGRKRGIVYAVDAENVSVTGPGTIHGNGTAFMEPDTPKGLEHTSGRHTRQGSDYRVRAADGPMIMRRRPGSLLHFDACRNVTIRDIHLRDAPEWTIHLSDCDVADIRGVRIDNNLLIPNNDGIHCVTCRNVHISDCDVQAGDDAIAITGLRGRPGTLCENITVNNCTLLSRSSGVRVGYGHNSIRRCTFQNLVIHNSNRGLGVFVRDEGSVSDILFDNIIIQTRLHTGWWGNGEPIHVSCLPQRGTTELGRIENVRFSNITADSEHGIVVWAADGAVMREVSLSDVRLRITESPINDQYGGNFDLRPAADDRFTVFSHDIPGLFARGVERLSIDGFRLVWAGDLSDVFGHGIECEYVKGLVISGFHGRQALLAEGGAAAISLRDVRDATVRDCRASSGTSTFLRHAGLSAPALFMGNNLRAARLAIDPEPHGFTMAANLLPERKNP